MIKTVMRPLNEDERFHLEQTARGVGPVLIIFQVIAALIAGKLCSTVCTVIANMVAPDWVQAISWGGFGIGVAVILFAAQPLKASLRRTTELAQHDLRNGKIEEVLVLDADPFEIYSDELRSPTLVLSVDENQLLFLQGKSLAWQGTYLPEAEREAEDKSDPEVFNKLAAPYSFPSNCFVITRFPQLGEIYRIRVEGDYQAPQTLEIKNVRKLCARLRDCEILSGEINALEDALAAAAQAARSDAF